jgi:hypothetical protein
MSLDSYRDKVFKGMDITEHPELVNEVATAYMAWRQALDVIHIDKTAYLAAEDRLLQITEEAYKTVKSAEKGFSTTN